MCYLLSLPGLGPILPPPSEFASVAVHKPEVYDVQLSKAESNYHNLCLHL